GPPAPDVAGYATDGDGDGIANVWDPADAIAGAARLLRANGAPANYRAAVFAYNHSSSHVDDVLAPPAKYRGASDPGAPRRALRAALWPGPAARRVSPCRPHLLRPRCRRRRACRALARERADRPVLRERQRREHSTARGLRHADRMGPLASRIGLTLDLDAAADL